MTISTATPPGGIQRRSARYTGCPICAKALSIAEVIERHCENCDRPSRPEEISETMIPPGALPITNPDSPAPP
ncbi:hypothetical protein [Rhizobium ruizarguesonis]|uniref:hypothetical protein n=1 Tax=Rhizobium ruizarguesonis TaxID=2081791 RepID=UPI00103132F4|nr:hypothetical protein [Rhizobium ruizarguesonis]TAU25579.1 hypothetical protein ELI48_04940 [Rhizobium ruizarguesonis]TAU67072.1 hypothetical protein ELI45_03905 [Rhizobium ruizarguesonis]TAW08820.1 hypothetical protein ELI26_04065 [Rhizobium ruizarguesonis]TAW15117.1 hypothetical protein ELI25_04285 [Rhizobium ruizarguesonis]TAW97285.1 hypothetical protein ELI12_04150 [Rhizobium ruizarguesonis]